MELDFDKEIDAILRKGGVSGRVPPGDTATPHLDADEVAAFAENALPERSKQAYVTHFAECDGCRKTLSNVIRMNSEAGIVPASSVAAPLPAAAEIPWYRRLFLFPNLAYVLGGLIVLFSGFIAVSVMRNSAGENSQISQVKPGEAPVTAPTVGLGASSNAAAANANTSIMTSANSMSNMAMNSNASPANARAAKEPASVSNAASGAGSSKPAGQPFVVDGLAAKDDKAPAAEAPPPSMQQAPHPTEQQSTADTTAFRKEEDRKKKREAEETKEKNEVNSRQLSNLPYNAGGSVQAMKSQTKNNSDEIRSRNVEPSPKKTPQSLIAAGRKMIGGKAFELKQGVWFDSVYQGQQTVNVRRGSEDFKKLDDGLRSVANSLSGPVVVVWNNKAYRIQ